MADETAVVDAGTPAAVETTPVATETPAVGTETAVETPASDPNDPMAALEAAMQGLLPDDAAVDPAATAEAGAVPEQFQQALEISDFVKSPEHVQQAVRAADEVWKVATGQLPARQMLEGFKQQNPQQYQAIVQDLASYIGEVTGQQFGAQAQASPLDGLKQANPEAYAEISKYFEQVTGKPLDGPADPRDARLTAVEQRYAKQERERLDEQFNKQSMAADAKTREFVASALKGTFAEGQESRLLNLLNSKGVFSAETMQKVLAGDTKDIEKALKAAQKDEVAALKAYNANLIKQHRKLANAVPGVKGTQTGTQSLEKLPGESTAQHASRLWKNGLV